jgi:hypothetical protein
VAMTAVADEVDNDIGMKLCAIFGGDAANAHNRVGIFGVDVEDRNALAASDAGSKTRRVLLRGTRGETDQIVDDDVNRSADRVCSKIRKIEGFRPDALAGERGVAVHDDGPDFVENFRRAIDVGTVNAVASLLGAGASHGDGIDSFEVAWIGDQVNIEFCAGSGGVHAGGADVIFHVSRAEDTAGIHVFETGDYLVNGLAGDVGHNAEAATVAHGHEGIDAAQITGGIQDGIKERDEGGVAFQREALAAEVAALEDLFEEVGTDEALKNALTVDFGCRAFHAFRDPGAALGLDEMGEFNADRAAVIAAGFLGVFTGKAVQVWGFYRGEEAEGIEGGLGESPAAETIENAFTFGLARAILRRAFLCESSGFFWCKGNRVSHGFYQPNYYFAIDRKERQAARRIRFQSCSVGQYGAFPAEEKRETDRERF